MKMRNRKGGIALFLVLLFIAYHFALTGLPLARSKPLSRSEVVARVLSYAESKEGCPYVWGGTGPCSAGYDCSGLVLKAFRTAGITFGLARPTAKQEWDYGPRVSRPERGDLVFFAGVDGTPQAPGHVGIVLNHDTMIDAYASGTLVRTESFGLPTSAPGLQQVVGYTDPA